MTPQKPYGPDHPDYPNAPKDWDGTKPVRLADGEDWGPFCDDTSVTWNLERTNARCVVGYTSLPATPECVGSAPGAVGSLVADLMAYLATDRCKYETLYDGHPSVLISRALQALTTPPAADVSKKPDIFRTSPATCNETLQVADVGEVEQLRERLAQAFDKRWPFFLPGPATIDGHRTQRRIDWDSAPAFHRNECYEKADIALAALAPSSTASGDGA